MAPPGRGLCGLLSSHAGLSRGRRACMVGAGVTEGSPEPLGVRPTATGVNVAVHSVQRRRDRVLPVRRRRRRRGAPPGPACRPHRRCLSRPYRRRGHRRALRLARRGAVACRRRAPLQSGQAAGRSLCAGARPAFPARSGAIRRPPRSAQPTDDLDSAARRAEGDRDRRGVPPMPRSAWRSGLGPAGHLRTACAWLHQAQSRHPRGPARHLRRARPSRLDCAI